MGDFPNHHSFSKEIAESIGLEEAIIFEKIKSEDNKKISKKKLIEVLSYISKSKINESLHRLEEYKKYIRNMLGNASCCDRCWW